MLIKEIVEATKGKLLSGNENDEVLAFCQDTRKIQEGDMYIPLIGERTDGHLYIEQAFLNGASSILTDRKVEYKDKNIILVNDTYQAMVDMAKYIRASRNVKIVGVTGSVGKTSTKDMIYSVVSTKYKTLKTLGNYNNHIGLPLTMLRHKDEEVMILEMGMNHLGEISHLTHIAHPDVAAITNVGTAHIGELGSRENILKAKMEIVEGLSESGVLVINDDNDMLHTVSEGGFILKRVGKNERCHLKAENIELRLEDSYFDIAYNNEVYHVHVPVSGEHFVYNALVAIQIGLALDIPMEQCIEGVEKFELTKNRMDILDLKTIKVIDGTYNANLDSMKSSLDVLAQYKNRKVAILADMLELGTYEQSLHEQVGEHVVLKGIDELICVGKASLFMVEKAKSLGYTHACHFENNEQLIASLNDLIKEGDVLLLKGSNGMKLKEVVEYLKEKF